MGKLKELWQSFAPGVRVLLMMLFLYLVIIGLLNVSLESALFWSLLVTAFFFPAIISGTLEVIMVAWGKISGSFKNKKG